MTKVHDNIDKVCFNTISERVSTQLSSLKVQISIGAAYRGVAV